MLDKLCKYLKVVCRNRENNPTSGANHQYLAILRATNKISQIPTSMQSSLPWGIF